jgi:glycosyltransferase 2 family protein
MGNNVYPARAGEFIRAYVLKRNENVSASASFATIVVERIFDGIVMLIFVLVALPLAPSLPDWLRRVVILGSVVFFGALIAFLALASAPKRFAAVYNGLVSRFVPARLRPGVVGILDRFVEGLACLRSPLDLLMIFVTSLVIWLTETVKYWFVMHAFPGHGFPVSFFALMLMNGIVNLATTIPSAPGYVGTFDTPGIEVLKVFGVEAATAAGYTVVLHMALWLPITLLGFWYLAREGLRWSDFRQAEQLRQAQ